MSKITSKRHWDEKVQAVNLKFRFLKFRNFFICIKFITNQVMPDIPKFFLNVGFPIINPLQCKYQLFETGTNKPLGEVKFKEYQQKVEIDKETGKVNVLLYPDFTEEQKQIEDKNIKMYKQSVYIIRISSLSFIQKLIWNI